LSGVFCESWSVSHGKGGTLAFWSNTFVVQGADETEVVEHFEALYRTGLERLKAVVDTMG